MASLRGPFIVAVALSLSCLALSQDPFAEAAQALKWREVGPWRGGRSVAAPLVDAGLKAGGLTNLNPARQKARDRFLNSHQIEQRSPVERAAATPLPRRERGHRLHGP